MLKVHHAELLHTDKYGYYSYISITISKQWSNPPANRVQVGFILDEQATREQQRHFLIIQNCLLSLFFFSVLLPATLTKQPYFSLPLMILCRFKSYFTLSLNLFYICDGEGSRHTHPYCLLSN